MIRQEDMDSEIDAHYDNNFVLRILFYSKNQDGLICGNSSSSTRLCTGEFVCFEAVNLMHKGGDDT